VYPVPYCHCVRDGEGVKMLVGGFTYRRKLVTAENEEPKRHGCLESGGCLFWWLRVAGALGGRCVAAGRYLVGL
jgi:hypothetical protein